MTTLTDFHDLDVPAKGATQWFVRSGAMYYLLNYSMHLGGWTDYAVDDFLFDTESSAHKQAAFYYQHHGRIYPYANEWSAALANEGLPTFPVAASSDNDSEPMEFI